MFHTGERTVSSPPLKQGFALGVSRHSSYKKEPCGHISFLTERYWKFSLAVHYLLVDLPDLNFYLALCFRPVRKEAVTAEVCGCVVRWPALEKSSTSALVTIVPDFPDEPKACSKISCRTGPHTWAVYRSNDPRVSVPDPCPNVGHRPSCPNIGHGPSVGPRRQAGSTYAFRGKEQEMSMTRISLLSITQKRSVLNRGRRVSLVVGPCAEAEGG
jgi:hypothetical protein